MRAMPGETFTIELDGTVHTFDAEKYGEVRDRPGMNADDVR